MTDLAFEAQKYIQQHSSNFKPKIGIILGSGLSAVADAIKDPVVLKYADIPGFPKCSIEGHSGELFLGMIDKTPVACLSGRAHYYEGKDNTEMQTYIRALKLIGCKALYIASACGSLRKEVSPGNLVVVHDHLNFQYRSVLVGENDDRFGPRFIGMEDAYDKGLRQKLQEIATKLDIPLETGVYVGVLGPQFETPAEIRAYKILGADVVGMSTVPEVTVAKHCGMKVAVLAAITNLAAGMHEGNLSHEVTLQGAEKAQANLLRLTMEFVKQFGEDDNNG